VNPPQIVSGEFGLRRRLEAHHLDALWVDAPGYGLDGSVFAAGIHRLQYHEKRLTRFCVQLFLILCSPFSELAKKALRLLAAQVPAIGSGRIPVRKSKRHAGKHLVRFSVQGSCLIQFFPASGFRMVETERA
jgi:hypothetical protein